MKRTHSLQSRGYDVMMAVVMAVVIVAVSASVTWYQARAFFSARVAGDDFTHTVRPLVAGDDFTHTVRPNIA